MRTYFSLQFKRVMKVFPFILLVTVVLFAALAVLLSGLMSSFNNSEKNAVFKVGITGDTDNEMLQLAIVAFQSFDESRFSLEFIEMEKTAAETALHTGDISAYLELPEDFVEKAMRGEIEPMYYVTTVGSNNIAHMFKNEITALVTDVVVSSQQGSFGLQEVLDDKNVSGSHGELVNALAIEYVNLVLKRTEAITVDELGISEGMRTGEYYLCGMTLLFLMLLGLPYVVVYARQDRSLNVLLLSRGVSGMRQLWDEWLSHFLSLLCLAAVVFAPVLVLSAVSDNATLLMLSLDEWLTYIAFFIPVLVMVSTFNLFIFEIGGNVVSSALLHFFSVLCMCYVSGCFYPVYTFPKAIQAVERLLPTGVARETLAIALSDEAAYRSLIGVAVYAVLFFAGAWLVRMAKLRRREGGA